MGLVISTLFYAYCIAWSAFGWIYYQDDSPSALCWRIAYDLINHCTAISVMHEHDDLFGPDAPLKYILISWQSSRTIKRQRISLSILSLDKYCFSHPYSALSICFEEKFIFILQNHFLLVFPENQIYCNRNKIHRFSHFIWFSSPHFLFDLRIR